MTDPRYNPNVPLHVPASLIHDYDLMDYQSQDPFERANNLLKSGAPEIFWTRNGGGHWLVTGTEAINGVNTDPSTFSSIRTGDKTRRESYEPYFPPVDVDPPLHTAYRAAVAPFFTPPRIEAVKQQIQHLSKTLIAEIKQRGECEFMEDFAAQMPVTMFLRLLDLPEKDGAILRAIVLRVISSRNYEEAAIPFQELSAYLLPIVEDRIARPGTDALSHIAKQKIDGRTITTQEIVKLARTLVVGGLDTTSGLLGYIALYLAEAPEVRRQLIAAPETVSRAIEELLRRFPVTNLGRWVTRDTVYRGVSMKEGDAVMCPLSMFNLDERRFPDAISVKIDRTANRHAAFGIGIHTCVGSVLARAELRIFVDEWLREIPDFYIKHGAKIEFREGSTLIYQKLPLVLGIDPATT